MARFEVNGIEGFYDKMLQRDAATQAAVPEMLQAGAQVVKKAQKEEIKKVFTSDRSFGDLADSVGETDIKKDGETTKIHVYPQGKDRHGVRNATKGFVQEYGRSNMPASPWFKTANAKCADDVTAAQKKVWEEKQQ